jgi:hypothetical protein
VPNTSSHIIQYFLKRTLCLRIDGACPCACPLLAKVLVELIPTYFHSFEIFVIQMAFCKPDFIIIKSNYFQNAQKGECLLDDFEALLRERRFRALLCGREMSF